MHIQNCSFFVHDRFLSPGGIIIFQILLIYLCIVRLNPVESHSKYGQRTAIVCLKDGMTPRKYPRDPGIPAKLPL